MQNISAYKQSLCGQICLSVVDEGLSFLMIFWKSFDWTWIVSLSKIEICSLKEDS